MRAREKREGVIHPEGGGGGETDVKNCSLVVVDLCYGKNLETRRLRDVHILKMIKKNN